MKTSQLDNPFAVIFYLGDWPGDEYEIMFCKKCWFSNNGKSNRLTRSKSKIDLRLIKTCTGLPVCADRSVQSWRYDQSDFRLTKSYAGPKYNEKTREN